MFENFPKTVDEPKQWAWSDWQPYFDHLQDTDLSADTIDTWLENWSTVGSMFSEVFSRLHVAKDIDTTDEAAEKAYMRFVGEIYPEVQRVNFQIQKKLVASGLEPASLKIPMRNIKTDVEIFCEDNVPLSVQENDIANRYNKILGAQTVTWEGEEITLTQLGKVMQDTDRDKREKAFRLANERRAQDFEELNAIWREYMDLRKQISQNASFDNFRSYTWKDLNRHDYSPEQALQFVDAIEQVVVPAAERMAERRRVKMGLDKLAPWDVAVDEQGREPLVPYETMDEFLSKSVSVFQQVDPELGAQFKMMIDEKLLDLDNRKGKAPGGYCTGFLVTKRPFIFMNSVGLDGDVRTLLHEVGHALHGFASYNLPLMQQQRAPMEFNEVASMAMELLASPYLTEDKGGYFSEADASRFRADHLKGIIDFWPYMAVVVAFQHWIYTNHDLATDPLECDKKWLELWGRFMKNADYSGHEEFIKNRWRRQIHIYRRPFYYVEYGLAQLGAVQVWAKALQDQQSALDDYRSALALGGTVTLPELYQAAGVKLAFDAETLQEAVNLLESTIDDLEALAH
ncbi:MAG: M3 family oligoendopeptidase [Anaerolineae bacterium]|nr:M3 family oligoendopeptidase [Anaerolineae bacterium]